MEKERFHLIIPSMNIKKEIITKTGGGKSYKRDDIVAHSKSLKQNFSFINEELRKHKESGLTESVIIAIKTPKGWDVSNEKGHLERIGFRFLEYSRSDPSIATLITTKKKWTEIGNRIDTYASTKGRGKTYFQGLDSFMPRLLSDKLTFDTAIDGMLNISISLFSVLDIYDRKKIADSIINDCNVNNYYAKLIELSDNYLINVSAPVKYIKLLAEEYLSIKAITKNEIISIERSTATFPVDSLQVLSTPMTDQVIGVIDDGVAIRSDINKLIFDRVSPNLPNSVAPITRHGTYVASRCLFGDISSPMLKEPLQPACRIADIPVFGVDKYGTELKPSESDLIKAIDSYVTNNYKSIRIYNISLGFGRPIVDKQFSLTAKLLDKLSKKYDVLFVVSAGNIDSCLANYPNEHFASPFATIKSPSESLLCLCVGSIAKNESPMSKINEISPFSRVGPGLNGSIKPDLVAHGGNLGASFLNDPNVCTLGFAPREGMCDRLSGTSFSAPVISYYATLIKDYYPLFSMNMVKALMVHTADIRVFPNYSALNPVLGCGYGEPDLDLAFRCKENSCIYLYEGILDTNNYQYVKFDIPKMDSNQNYDLRVKVTIVYDPEINEDNDLEYCSARISSNILKLSDGEYIKQIPDERNLSEMYNPIIRYERTFKRKIMPGEWAVKLRLFTRNITEEHYLQKFAIVIEISDETYNRDLRKYVIEENEEKYILKKKIEKTA